MILSIDPGVTTGFATENLAYQLRFDTDPYPHQDLFHHITDVAPSFIIYEPFHYRQGMLNAVFTGVEYIGVINLWAQVNNIKIKTVNPSDGKGFWDNNKIKTLGLWNPSAYPHGMDALRLLLTWKMKNDNAWKAGVLEALRERNGA